MRCRGMKWFFHIAFLSIIYKIKLKYKRFIENKIKDTVVSLKITTKNPERISIRDFNLEVPPRFELGIRVLQTHALPLGYGTE